jgi:hypothetical protein
MTKLDNDMFRIVGRQCVVQCCADEGSYVKIIVETVMMVLWITDNIRTLTSDCDEVRWWYC